MWTTSVEVQHGAGLWVNVVQSQQKGGPWGLVLLFLHLGYLQPLLQEGRSCREGEKSALKHTAGGFIYVYADEFLPGQFL